MREKIKLAVVGRHRSLLHHDQEQAAASGQDGSQEIRPEGPQARGRTRKRRSSSSLWRQPLRRRQQSQKKPAFRRAFSFRASGYTAQARLHRVAAQRGGEVLQHLDAAGLGLRDPVLEVLHAAFRCSCSRRSTSRAGARGIRAPSAAPGSIASTSLQPRLRRVVEQHRLAHQQLLDAAAQLAASDRATPRGTPAASRCACSRAARACD